MTPCKFVRMGESKDVTEEGYLVMFFEDNGIRALIRTKDGSHLTTYPDLVRVTGEANKTVSERFILDVERILDEYVPFNLKSQFLIDITNIYEKSRQ